MTNFYLNFANFVMSYFETDRGGSAKVEYMAFFQRRPQYIPEKSRRKSIMSALEWGHTRTGVPDTPIRV